MIKGIDLRHFKCFETLKLPLRPLTLLSGSNASGKSTVMQALVLLHQTMREHEWSSRLLLNGNTIRLGTAGDVIDQVYGRRECEIGILDDEKTYSWVFVGEHVDMVMQVARVGVNGKSRSNSSPLQNLLPHPHGQSVLAQRLRGLTYLSAERIGPQETYQLEDPRDVRVVGSKGEHAVSILYADRDTILTSEMVMSDAPPTLLRQVEARMARFFPGCGLTLERIPHTNFATLGLRTSTDTHFHRPVHTGFGLIQIFPIIVAALSAEIGALLLIENPEVHLHPVGQAAMGEFLAEVASTDVQVVLETHSDHVLNGIRRAVRKDLLLSEHVALHFFRPRGKTGKSIGPQVESPAISSDGTIDCWPDGFFDQFDHDMNYLAGWN